VLEHLLRKQDRTYEEIAVDFERLARATGERGGVGITARHLRRLAAGQLQDPNPATRRVLKAMFNMPVEQLLRPWTGPDSTNVKPAADTVETVDTANPINTVDTAVTHHQLKLLDETIEEARGFTFHDPPADGSVVEAMHEKVSELATLYVIRPVPEILPRIMDTHHTIVSLLKRRQTPANARHLYLLGAVVAGLLANAASDIAKPDKAMDHTQTALVWAGYAGHPGLVTWIRGWQSFICFWADRPSEAIRFADLGAATANETSGTATAWLVASQARAWTALGNAEEAHKLIRSAERIRQSAVEDDLDALGGLCTFSNAKFLYYAGRALAVLPAEGVAAEQFSADAITTYQDRTQPGWDITCLSDSHISLALARISKNELDGVADSLATVLALPPQERIRDLINGVEIVRERLNRFDSRDARDLQEQITTFTQASLPRMVG
jgi:hypothetical protein